MDTVFYFLVMKMFWNWVEVVVTQHGEGTWCKCHRIVHLKMINFILCEFYLNKKVKLKIEK